MENIKSNLSKNLISLRRAHNLTQADLANKLNYSDKAISKWERGESIPDIEILYQISKLYGVTIDALITEEDIMKKKKPSVASQRVIITLLSILAVWIVATFAFVFLSWGLGNEIKNIWLVFIYAIPASAIVWLVFNCIWGPPYINTIIISVLIWTLTLAFFLTTDFENNSLIFFIAIPLQIATILWFFLIIAKLNYKTIFKNLKSKEKITKENKKDDKAIK